MLEVLVASTLFAILISSAWVIAVHTTKTLQRNRRIHRDDVHLSPLSLDDCHSGGGAINYCTRGDETSVIMAEDR